MATSLAAIAALLLALQAPRADDSTAAAEASNPSSPIINQITVETESIR